MTDLSPDTFRALCAELIGTWAVRSELGVSDFWDKIADIDRRARAALAQPEPEPVPVGPEPGHEKGYAQEHLARLMRDAIGVDWFDICKRMLHNFDDLVANSDGISGLHLNGDIATWEDLTEGSYFLWPEEFTRAREAIAAELEALPE